MFFMHVEKSKINASINILCFPINDHCFFVDFSNNDEVSVGD